MKFLKPIVACIFLFSSIASFAGLTINDVKNNISEPYSVKIQKNKDHYELVLFQYLVLDKNGNVIKPENEIEKYTLYRKVTVIVNINYSKHERLGGKYQLLGFGDDDAKTGSFSRLTNMQVRDLLTTYTGSSYNAGIVFIGGGYSKAMASNGIKFSEGNGSLLLPGPTGMPIGINAGFEKLDYEFTISSPLKRALVEYTMFGVVDNKKVLHEEKQETISVDSILNAELKE